MVFDILGNGRNSVRHPEVLEHESPSKPGMIPGEFLPGLFRKDAMSDVTADFDVAVEFDGLGTLNQGSPRLDQVVHDHTMDACFHVLNAISNRYLSVVSIPCFVAYLKG